jgi:hypothetical protein
MGYGGELLKDEKYQTELLLKRLFKTNNIKGFINQYGEQMRFVPFNVYISQLCTEIGTVPHRVIAKSGIQRAYGHQIFSGLRRPSRDKVIMIAFGFEMDYDKAQDLLTAARKSTLYPRIMRDAAIIYAFNKRLTLTETQDMLKELTLPVLGKDD